MKDISFKIGRYYSDWILFDWLLYLPGEIPVFLRNCLLK